MIIKRRRLVYEEFFYDEKVQYKIEIFKNDMENGYGAQLWKIVLFLLFLAFLFVVFIASLFLVTWRRPGLYLEDCIHRSCESGFNLKCINSTCRCPSNDFYYLKKCLPKKSHGKFCHNSQEQCQQGLTCFNGKCSCNKLEHWTGVRCSNGKNYAENCNGDSNCLSSLFLICDPSSKMCICDSTRFWSGNACYRKRSNGEICGSHHSACKNELGLFCLNGYCSCNETSMFYDNSANICLPKKGYMEACLNSQECSHLAGLYCSHISICVCLNSSFLYFDSNSLSCIPKKNETETCKLSIQCLGDMICFNDSCQCSNATIQYFDSSQLICLNKTLKGISCATNITCRSDLGLNCVNGSCQCDIRTSFWSSVKTKCVDCPSGWTIYQDKCYFVYNNLDTWDSAQSTCESNGGNLVSIRTQADYEMVSGYYNQYTNYANLWVGAEMNITYDFYWRDGFTKMNETYPNANWWCPGKPDNFPLNSPVGITDIRQGCVRMQKFPNGCNDLSIPCTTDVCLNDWECNDQHAFLCERE